jgi:N-methylhydantoinase A
MERVAKPLGLSIHETANGILEIANANMVGAIRTISVQRGFDPREFVLVGFGGAGPLHANGLAASLGMPRILLPMSPGVTSAVGLLVGDIKHDFVQALIGSLASLDLEDVYRIFKTFEDRGRELLAAEGIADGDMDFVGRFDMRYQGQSYELTVDDPDTDSDPRAALADAFVLQHERVYGYASQEEPMEVVNVRMTAIGRIRRPKLRQLERGDADPAQACKGRRPVYFKEAGGICDCPIYDRYALLDGNQIPGPAIVEEYDSTVVIHPGYSASVDQAGNILIEEAGT